MSPAQWMAHLERQQNLRTHVLWLKTLLHLQSIRFRRAQ
jgi:hypothetical protein